MDRNEKIRDEIIKDVEHKFGWKIQNTVPNNLGYGNLKWLMETNHGAIFVKQYDKVRYRRGLDGVEQALRYQTDFFTYGGMQAQYCHAIMGYLEVIGGI